MRDSHILETFRRWGYLQADLGPAGAPEAGPHPELDVPGEEADRARAVYCGKIGWSSGTSRPGPAGLDRPADGVPHPAPLGERDRLLELLIRAYLFERVAQTRYPGTKRFSLEGATFVLPSSTSSWTGPSSRAPGRP